ncbi:energy-coupling factor transporter transmembrane component T family protein [Alterisphingorhabdus coralli]|uniref:Energy-coupling factor transporter transmembrane component T n=1 Tax=Alterisphingorhabdus coralli TaxID=3071408 RepID=A0AA97F3R4_9SPHN|nr:energy-coupling factor transporter transmembrane component T [Parasphingorhabdus sp. SCSIO 66989]WOE73766.1 energy-coupling factor transporter transmembrane component T [Parasphingorhabdus sp. SCSIO 66989]
MKVPTLHTGKDNFWRRRDPRVKWALFFIFILLIYLAPDWRWMAAASLAGFFIALTAQAPVGWLLLMLMIQIPNVTGLVIIPMLGSEFTFNDEFRFGLHMGFGWIAAILIGISLFSTMDVDELVSGLRGIGLPKQLAFVVGYAFVLVYLSFTDLSRIYDSMRLKGLELSWRQPIVSGRNLLTMFIPALITIVRRGGTMATALEARGSSAQNSIQRPAKRLDIADILVLGCGLASLIAAIIL